MFLKPLIRLGIFIAAIFTTSKYLIVPIITTRISDPALITIFICSIIIMLSVVLPFIIRE